MTQAVRAATDTIPIVASGAYTGIGVVPSLAHPGGNVTGITVDVGWDNEINGKRLQILKEAVPWASTVAVLAMRTCCAHSYSPRRSQPTRTVTSSRSRADRVE